MKKTFFTFLLLLSSLGLFGFNWANQIDTIGNGGDAVVCRDTKGSITRIELYDYYEAENIYSIQLDLGNPKDLYEKKVENLFNKLEQINPTRVALYRSWYKDFWNKTKIVTGLSLTDQPDTQYVPYGCNVEQVILRNQGFMAPGQSEYTLNGDLWNAMDSNSKAGLIMHVLMLREVVTPISPGYYENRPHVNSVRTRYFNETLASKDFASFTRKQFFDLIAQVMFRNADIHGGIPVYISDSGLIDIQFYPDQNTVQQAYCKFELKPQMFLGQKFNLRDQSCEFYQNGTLKHFQGSIGQWDLDNGKFKGTIESANGFKVSFYDNGKVSEIDDTSGYRSSIIYQLATSDHQKIGCTGLRFNDLGELQSCLNFRASQENLPVVIQGRSYPFETIGITSGNQIDLARSTLVLGPWDYQTTCKGVVLNAQGLVQACKEGGVIYRKLKVPDPYTSWELTIQDTIEINVDGTPKTFDGSGSFEGGRGNERIENCQNIKLTSENKIEFRECNNAIIEGITSESDSWNVRVKYAVFNPSQPRLESVVTDQNIKLNIERMEGSHKIRVGAQVDDQHPIELYFEAPPYTGLLGNLKKFTLSEALQVALPGGKKTEYQKGQTITLGTRGEVTKVEGP